MNVKDYVVQELESYPRTLRQIAVLRYELEHPVQVSTVSLENWDGYVIESENVLDYKLTLTYSINGNTKPPVTVTSKCN